MIHYPKSTCGPVVALTIDNDAEKQMTYIQ